MQLCMTKLLVACPLLVQAQVGAAAETKSGADAGPFSWLFEMSRFRVQRTGEVKVSQKR
jgi:hypothetical protein